jgi:hypothetical protein
LSSPSNFFALLCLLERRRGTFTRRVTGKFAPNSYGRQAIRPGRCSVESSIFTANPCLYSSIRLYLTRTLKTAWLERERVALAREKSMYLPGLHAFERRGICKCTNVLYKMCHIGLPCFVVLWWSCRYGGTVHACVAPTPGNFAQEHANAAAKGSTTARAIMP